MAETLHKVLKSVNRLRKTPITWKIATVYLFFKGDRRQVENYPPIVRHCWQTRQKMLSPVPE